MVWVAKEGTQHEAGEAGITRVLFERFFDRFQNVGVSLRQLLAHLDWYHALVIGRQVRCNIFERDKGGVLHQVLAKQQGTTAGPALDGDRRLGRFRTCVVRSVAFDYFLADAIGALKDTPTFSSPRIAV